MPNADHGYGHAVSRYGSSTALWSWDEGDSGLGLVWEVSSTYAYNGTESSMDRCRGHVYYGLGGGTATNNRIAVLSLVDGTVHASSNSGTYDNYGCVWVHPNGTAFYLDKVNGTPSSNMYKVTLDGTSLDFAVFQVNSSSPRAAIYHSDCTPDIYERPDRKVILFGIDSTTYWNAANADPGTFYVQQYDMVSGISSNLFSFSVATYATTMVVARFFKGWVLPGGDILIAIGTASSTDGGFYGRFERDGTAVWTVGERTVNGDVRCALYAGLDMISYKHLYIGSGGTSDPEPVGQIDVQDGSVNSYVDSLSATAGQQHRTHGAHPLLYGRIVGTPDDFIQPWAGAVYFSGYTGHHNPNPNIAHFDGDARTEYNNTDTTVVRYNTSSKHSGAAYDCNGMRQAACLAGNPITINGEVDHNVRLHSYGDDHEMTGDDDYILETYGSDMVRQMRHGKFWMNAVQCGMAGT
jgi:hypothetical protein